MQRLLNALRRTGATRSIMLSDLDFANGRVSCTRSDARAGWLNHRPVDPAAQLVASVHVNNHSYCHGLHVGAQTSCIPCQSGYGLIRGCRGGRSGSPKPLGRARPLNAMVSIRSRAGSLSIVWATRLVSLTVVDSVLAFVQRRGPIAVMVLSKSQLAGPVEQGRAGKCDSRQPALEVILEAGRPCLHEKVPGPISPPGCEPNRPPTVAGIHAKTDTLGTTNETDDSGRFRVYVPSRVEAVVLKGVEARRRESRGITQPCGRHNPRQHRRKAFRETDSSRLIDIGQP